MFREKITEELSIFLDIVKWFFLASVVGALVGGACAGFIHLMERSSSYGDRSNFTLWLLPAAMIVCSIVTRRVAPSAAGHGTETVIESIHRRGGIIGAMVIPVKVVTTLATLACRGSVGKEGPCALVGGAVSSLFARVFGFSSDDRRQLVMCGISGGFAAVFGTPIAGAIFGVEVLFIGNILYGGLLASFISGIVSFQVARQLGIVYNHGVLGFAPVFSESFFLKVAFAGVFFGVCSFIMINLMNYGHRVARKFAAMPVRTGLLGGLLVMLIVLVVPRSESCLGLGLDTINLALAGHHIVWYIFLIKIVLTSITLNFGGSGGIITPLFFVGATSGVLFADLFELNPATFAAIGLVSVVSGACNTPIAASIMSVEMFGPRLALYATVACVISFLMSGHRSVYPSQILAMRKSQAVESELGREIEDVHPHVHIKEGSSMHNLLGFLRHAVRLFFGKKP